MGKFKVKTDKQTYNQVRSLLLESGFHISAPTGKDWVIGELGGIISSYSNWRGEPPEWLYTVKEITIPELRAMVNNQYAEIEQVRQASKDNVNNPQHYNKGGVECIDAIEASMTPEAFKGYLKGNVQKYMWRYEQKGGVESLRKAQWYLARLVASMDS